MTPWWSVGYAEHNPWGCSPAPPESIQTSAENTREHLASCFNLPPTSEVELLLKNGMASQDPGLPNDIPNQQPCPWFLYGHRGKEKAKFTKMTNIFDNSSPVSDLLKNGKGNDGPALRAADN
ncbi:hypothetical protein DUI87_05884 [Hirundo rustica rustica]|uniref:Uncharacterized protein n=1 Tax=Hirundo rustica rustica TaxID=333673 RepID=A0A3M0KVW5_HIRRU|nr:hypothetical protein DUI87_05884 [Hirundo rustica rustica]